jgi:UDP-2,3-diacylglucosamine pyrophosphatase LpxH
MKRLMNFLMLSCKKATELIETKSIFGLSWKENIQLKAHTKMCNACSIYQKQSKEIDTLLEKHIHKADENKVPEIENKKLKEAILHNLEQ